jgi:hypothetical protein
MAAAVQKITLSFSRDIPFNKFALSQSNVRHVKARVSVEEHPNLRMVVLFDRGLGPKPSCPDGT